jgi:cyanoexosortase A
MAVFHTSQSATVTVFAVLIWGGALICMEDQLESLRPQPTAIGLLAGTILLIWVLTRSATILHWDGVIFFLAPMAGLALTLLCYSPARYRNFRDPFLCLMLLPAFALLMRILPEEPISLLTAQISGFWLSTLGLDVLVRARNVYLPTGGVEVLGPCNGVDMMAQILCVAVIFILAFPIQSKSSRLIIFMAAPLLGLICNTMRISLLAYIVSAGHGKGSHMFDFFHTDGGSLVFSGVAVFFFGMLYMNLLERELPPISNHS